MSMSSTSGVSKSLENLYIEIHNEFFVRWINSAFVQSLCYKLLLTNLKAQKGSFFYKNIECILN